MATRGKPQTKEAKLLDMLYGKPAAGDLRNTPMLKQTGEGSYLRQQYPEGYGFGAGLLGTLPNDISGSVLDPNTARVKQGAKYGLPTGVALEATPLVGPALKGAKMTSKALGAGLNEAIYHGAQSPLSKFIPEAVKPLNVVKPKGGGGNWFKVDKELERLKPNAGINPRDADELGIAGRGDAAVSSWIDTKLNKYVRNELGTEKDPVRLLAEKGKLHFEPDVSSALRRRAQQHRRAAGFPEQGSSESQLAVDWEALADSQIQGGKAKDHQLWPTNSIRSEAKAGSWIHDVSPDAPAYEFGTSFSPTKLLGFDHLVDELRNATALGDNLPKVLQIDPKKLEQMSVSDVVNHVYKINEWRANQATRSHDATIKALENSPAISVMKEYPDGYKWVELKMPETVHDITPLIRKNGNRFEIYEPGQSLEWKDPNTGKVDWSSPEEASAAYSEIKNYRELEKVLDLEGNSMGHCVGGYCSDVISGRSRIFSLRDPKDRAHATIQVKPPTGLKEGTISQEELPPAVFKDLKRRNVLDENIRWKFDDATGRYMPEVGPFEPSIVQIKGKQNARPVEKYDPYTQDFVQNNDWGEVNELRNTGLVDLGNKNYKSMDEIKKTYQYLDDSVDPPQWTNLGELVERDFPNGFRRDNFLTGVAERLKEQSKRTDLPEMIRPAPVEAAPALPPLPAPTPEPVTNPFWYNPKSKQLEAFDVENTHTKSLMDPDYATKLGVAPLDPSSLNMEHGSLLMGRTDKVAPNTLSLMQVDEFTPESLSSIQAMLNEKNLPHEKFSLSGGSSLYENVPAEAIRGAKTLEDLKQFRIGGEEPPSP